MSSSTKLVDIKSAIKKPWAKALYSVFGKPLEWFLGINQLNATYEKLVAHPEYGNFFNRAVCAIGYSYEVDEKEIKKIPTEGPLIVVANHPLGGLDGITLGAVLLSAREDSKLLLNYLICKMPEVHDWAIGVNPFGGKDAMKQNLNAMREMISHLKNGGCLGVFPSGTVSYLHGDFSISDPEWNVDVAKIARRTNAKVLPVYFEGHNSWTFYLAGLIHPKLRTLFLVRELFKFAKSKKNVRLRIGTPIDPRRFDEFKTDADLTSWMRINSYILRSKKYQNAEEAAASMWQIKNIKSLGRIFPLRHRNQELILPVDSEIMAKEIAALPEECAMIKGEKISVYCAEAWRIPNALMEIGRLREKTFREVGEGTGKSLDIDEFDQYYLHMFMWDAEAKKIAGAYRVGRTDKIIQSLGTQGLYVSTLFKIKPELIEKLSPALEMGRSFVVSEYQKKRSTLAILWRGIGAYLAANPRYRTLYGPVSISADYNAISKDLIVQFLREKKTSGELSKLVKAKRPPKIKLKNADKQALSIGAHDIDHISALVSEVELDNKGIPTLLKHYLKLDGELLAFNIDNSFGNCIDGLIMVNLLKTDPKLLKSYMGAQQTIDFRAHHGLETPQL